MTDANHWLVGHWFILYDPGMHVTFFGKVIGVLSSDLVMCAMHHGEMKKFQHEQIFNLNTMYSVKFFKTFDKAKECAERACSTE